MSTPGTQYALFESLEALPVEAATAAESPGRKFSDYVVFVDESGDHSLASIDAGYPVFVLALCVFHKRHYAEKIIPAVTKLKFNYFGHDSVILHENEIRKQKGDAGNGNGEPDHSSTFNSRRRSILNCERHSFALAEYAGLGECIWVTGDHFTLRGSSLG